MKKLNPWAWSPGPTNELEREALLQEIADLEFELEELDEQGYGAGIDKWKEKHGHDQEAN